MNRRHFTRTSVLGIAATTTLLSAKDRQPSRVGVIGHTGRGNFGHGLDTVWLKLKETEIVAVADAVPAGLERAKKKLKVESGFPDYRRMLAEAKPDIVAVCPRHVDQRRDMILACIEADVRGIYIEKPFAQTPAQADEIIAAAESRGTKIAVAHRNRYHPVLPVVHKFLRDGGLGKVLEIRGRGKGDRRGGAEDIWVLGTHVLNLMMHFSGPPQTCSAQLWQGDRLATAQDVIQGSEGLGPLAGNELHARYQFANGIVGYFDSIHDDGTKNAGFGFQIIGSNGLLNFQCDKDPLVHLQKGNPFQPTTTPEPWVPITSQGVNQPETYDVRGRVQNHVDAARDLIGAIMTPDRQPLCDAREAALTVEMVCASFESHRQQGRAVDLPLKFRGNALAEL
jgi:predicted dehydrogenase